MGSLADRTHLTRRGARADGGGIRRYGRMVCCVHFKKAFDSINYKLLWSQMLAVLQSMYSSATSVSRYPVIKPLPLSNVKKESDRGVY